MNEISKLPKEKTLIKRNNIIKMVILDKKELSTDALRLYNFLYMGFQFNRSNIETSEKYILNIEHTMLKNELNINTNNYYEIVTKSLNELLNTQICIKDFINEKGQIVKQYNTHLITEWVDFKSEKDNKTKCYSVTVTKTMFTEMMKSGKGYTKLDFRDIKNLSSANYIRLYEFCKSFQVMKNTPQLSLEDLNDLFMTSFKFFSKIEELIKRSIKAINKGTDIEIEYFKDKKNKTISFKIIKEKQTLEEKQKQKYAIKKSIEEEEMIEGLLNQSIV